MDNLQILAKTLGEELVKEMLVPEIEKLSKDVKWRVRLATVTFLPNLMKFISLELFTDKISPILKSYLEDTVH
jgi:hypothetical protein